MIVIVVIIIIIVVMIMIVIMILFNNKIIFIRSLVNTARNKTSSGDC